MDQERPADPFRVTFVHAPNRYYTEVQNNGLPFMPVWAYTLASHLPDEAGYRLDLVDTRFDRLETTPRADVFLLSGINQDCDDLIAARGLLASRHPAALFVIGGPICWSFDQAGTLDKLALFDHVVIGDGEPVVAALIADLRDGRPPEHVVRCRERFDIAAARPFHRPLLDATIGRYYGAVLEVSRGCPFLCEFCDIRVLPDNNRPHNKSARLIVEEIDHLCSLGVRTFLLACDNFIGDPRWAEEVVDGVLAWLERTPHRPVFYTWLTINLYKYPKLMRKMRRAGFDALFIGVESFNANALLETAKVQNESVDLVAAIRAIQSYGFPIVAGLIFGFDSDDEGCFQTTLDGITDAGLLSGDPSLLTALPGTPLYRRMRLAGRLRDGKLGLGGHKYHTNIRYLLPRAFMIREFLAFARTTSDGEFQLRRLRAFFGNIESGGNYVPLATGSYFDLRLALRIIRRNPRAVVLALRRVALFAGNPRNLYYFLRGLAFVAGRRGVKRRFGYLAFWLAVWTTIVVKYRGLGERDFDIESVAPGLFEPQLVLPDGYELDGDEPIPANKTRAQRRETTRSLGALVQRRREQAAIDGG
jgi:radical SAM superfamily enzyme YgiQ (UPF0313 family)